MNARFYAPDAHAPGDIVALPDEEAQHLTRVLRLKEGCPVLVFNGRGVEFDAVVESAAGSRVYVHVRQARDAAPEPRVAITLAQAVLKADKMDDVVRDAVMIGVAALQPVITARTEVSRAALERGGRRERWQRIAISSAKQCGRAVVPMILDVQPFDDALRSIGDLRLPGPALMLVEPRSTGEPSSIGDLEMTPPKEATILVGPEGGWTHEEVASAAASCRAITLGARTLRADAVAIIAVAALFTRWREF